VRTDGGLIALDVTTLTLDVDRGINPHAKLLHGSERFAVDANLSKAVILLEGYMVDSPTTVDVTGGLEAVSRIDFGKIGGGFNPNVMSGAGTWPEQYSIIEKGNSYTADSFFNGYQTIQVTLCNTLGVCYNIYFIKSNTTSGYNLGGSGKYHVSLIDASNNMRSASDIAGYLTTLINDGTNFDSSFNASLNGAEVVIGQNTKGKAGNSRTPQFHYTYGVSPDITLFKGGVNTDLTQGMSAGDKVMSLYAILNNSIDKDNSDDGVLKKWGFAIANNTFKNERHKVTDDYITGIQIPFNSQFNADGEKYKAMNFFMPTGANMNADDKTLDNARPASSVITDTDDSRDNTFIKGTITKATFVQIGGEPIYQFNIQFLPIDSII
jgi:hypothetical protein